MATRNDDQTSVNVWWVNQRPPKFQHSARAGFFFAPLRNKAGFTPPHWRRMEEIQAGDIVLHYSDKHVRAISRVQAPAVQAPYPYETDRDYGGHMGYLVRSEYYLLDPPIPRDVVASLQNLPTVDHPFNKAGGVKEGYLYRFGLEALKELANRFETNWPSWLLDYLRTIPSPSGAFDNQMLRQFVDEITRLRTAVLGEQRMRYKPLMLLAAIRTVVEGFDVAFEQGPLLEYYEQLAAAIGADSSRPEYPYYHLSGDGFWNVITDDGQRLVVRGTVSRRHVVGTRVQIAENRIECITNDQLRPYVLGAIRTHFESDEWSRLMDVWSELSKAVYPPWLSGATRIVVRPDLKAATMAFARALEESHLRYDLGFVRSFVASLAAKPFAILTGLSGSGKTQIALQFGNWLGHERVKLVAVRPDWTGSDALFGYEDALQETKDGRRAWYVPPALEFMLKAARDPEWPYLLILDEMNLAHVERYFADVLSGMESGAPCLPNVALEGNGVWRVVPEGPRELRFPPNLFIVGTVNVDETTYMFSPKVLDRANTLEFRVSTDDLADDLRRPVPCEPGPAELVKGFLAIATDPDWHVNNPHPQKEEISSRLRDLHRILSQFGFEFGHRVFRESLRFAAMLAAAGEPSVEAALDAIVMQKILPRLHGNRRRLEPVLEAVGYFAFSLEAPPSRAGETRFDPLNPPDGQGGPRLPRSFAKVQRMTANLRANQFASFAE